MGATPATKAQVVDIIVRNALSRAVTYYAEPSELIPADLAVLRAGAIHMRPRSFTGLRLLPDHSLILVISGRGRLISDLREWDLKESTLFCRFPGHGIRYGSASDQPLIARWVGFRGSESARVCLERIGLSKEEPAYNLGQAYRHWLSFINQIIEELMTKHPGYTIRCSGLLWQAFGFLLGRHKEMEAETSTDPVKRAELYITTHYAQIHDLDKLSQVVAMSRSHLSRKFKERYGVSPSAFLTATRLERAKQLLEEAYMPVKSIAIATGYRHVSHFYRVFNEYVGMSPGEYREARLRERC